MAITHPDCQFLLLGEGPDRADFEAQARGLENVSFLGHKDNIGSWLAALDLLLFPSLSEGLGSTILEAMQHNVPVIASKAGGIPDIVRDGENGILVPPGNAMALEQAINALLASPSRAKALVEKAKADLSVFSPTQTATAYQQLYRQLYDHSV